MNANRLRVRASTGSFLWILLVPMLVFCGCGGQDAEEKASESPGVSAKHDAEEQSPTDPAVSTDGDAKEQSPKSPAVSGEATKQLGAAEYVNEDVSFFVSVNDVLPRCKRVWQSNAVQSLLKLPAVSQIVAQMLASPEYQDYREFLEQNPMAVEGLPILEDALSQEIFFCTDSDLPQFLDTVGGMVGSMQLMAMRQMHMRYRGGPELSDFVDLVLDNRSGLKVPSLLMGYKLDKPEAAEAFLDKWLAAIGEIPYATLDKRTIATAEFNVVEWKGSSIPQDELSEMMEDLRDEGVSADKCQQLVEFLGSLRITIAVGVLDDYLMVSIGDGTPLLSKWGQGPSLAQSSELAPLRERLKPGLISVSYSSTQLQAVFLPRKEEFRELFEGLSHMIPDEVETRTGVVSGLRTRLRKDVLELLDEIVFPEPYSTLSFSFENKGIETYTYGPSPEQTSVDSSGPLTILGHRGTKPITFQASRASQNPGRYEFAKKWIVRAYGYFEDFMVPQMPEPVREDFENVMRVVHPFVSSLDETTRECLIPSAGSQSLVVIDGQGALEQMPPGVPVELKRPMPIPRIGVALELKDATKFAEAMKRYYQAAETFLAGIREIEDIDLPPQIKLYPPETAEKDGGALYFYRIPIDLGNDVFPCALLAEKLLILSSSSDLADEMSKTVPMPTCPITSPDQAAGSVAVVDITALLRLLRGVSDSVFELLQEENPRGARGGPDATMITMIETHVDAVLRSLGALRSYTSTTRVENGRVVEHSWFRVEDTPE